MKWLSVHLHELSCRYYDVPGAPHLMGASGNQKFLFAARIINRSCVAGIGAIHGNKAPPGRLKMKELE